MTDIESRLHHAIRLAQSLRMFRIFKGRKPDPQTLAGISDQIESALGAAMEEIRELRADLEKQLASEQARREAEKERDGLRVERDHQADLLVRHRAMGAVEDAWRWEGDQQRDDLESLTGGVLIAADDLRDVFARAERAEEERDQIVKALRHFHMPASFGSETCGMCGFNLRHALHFKREG